MRCSKCGANIKYDYTEINGKVYCIACGSEILHSMGIKGNYAAINIRKDPGEV